MAKKKKKEIKPWFKLSETEILIKRPIIVNWEEELICVKKVNGKKKEWRIPASKLLDYVWLTEPSTKKE